MRQELRSQLLPPRESRRCSLLKILGRVIGTDIRWFSEESEEPTGARIPLSIQANYYKPLRRTAEHGLPVCDLQLRSYSIGNLEFMADFALRAAYYANLPAFGPTPLPKKIERWTVPRGNFVHKKSQENFERVTYKRLIQIKDGNPETVELWLAFLRKHQFHGVGMKANVWNWEEIGMFAGSGGVTDGILTML